MLSIGMTFGDLLRDWRQRRRHSQLSLSLDAEISARHLSYLETGKSQPSRDMIGRLCDVLEVPRSERNTILSAAGFAPAFSAREWESEELASMRSATTHMLAGHDPFPGFALDRHWRLLQMNDAATRLFGVLGLQIGGSMLDAITDGGPAAQAIVNIEDVKAHMRARLQMESARYGGDPILDAARDRMISTAPAPVTAPALVPVEFSLGGLELSLFTVLAHFSSAEDIAMADMKIELLFPANSKTEAHLRELAKQ